MSSPRRSVDGFLSRKAQNAWTGALVYHVAGREYVLEGGPEQEGLGLGESFHEAKQAIEALLNARNVAMHSGGGQTLISPKILEKIIDAGAVAAWRRVLESVGKQKRMLRAFLEESEFQGVVDQSVVLAADDLHRSVIEESENLRLLVQAVASEFGGLNLTIRPLGQAQPEGRRVTR